MEDILDDMLMRLENRNFVKNNSKILISKVRVLEDDPLPSIFLFSK